MKRVTKVDWCAQHTFGVRGSPAFGTIQAVASLVPSTGVCQL